MTNQDILNRRLFSQQLSVQKFTTPVDIVTWFGAMQSQDFSGATWAISQRLKFIPQSEIQAAFDKGNILRTHVMRPTWHFVTPEDIRWMLELTGTRVRKFMGSYNKALGLDDEIFERSEKIIEKALEHNNYLTRDELGNVLKKKGITWQGNGLAHLVMGAELHGIICSGPKKGKRHTYALLSERIPQSNSLSRDKMLEELAKRYFQSHGPAQIIDFVWWSGLLTSDAKRGIELNSSMKNETVDGKTYYFFDESFTSSTTNIYLLPNYDEYTVALRDREILEKGIDTTKLDFRQNSLFNNVVVINGKIEGVWRRILKSKTVEIETRLFRNLSSAETKKLSNEYHKYATFLNLQLITK